MKLVPSLLVSVCVCSLYGANTMTYQSYNPSDGKFDLTQSIQYVLPDPGKFGPGPYPVFIYTPGTYEAYTSWLANLFTSQMAARGFLSASVQYMNTESNQSCSQYQPRAQGIYDANRSTSAVGVLCSLSTANCSKGIVTSGISQGGELVVLSRNYAPNVKAIYALSMGDYFVNLGFPLPCVDNANTQIPPNRLTIVNGASDPFFGGQSPIQNVSGISCPAGSTQCWSADGSGAGWYIVQDSQNRNGFAGHCYMFDTGTQAYACVGLPDPNWLPPSTHNWSLAPNLDWLASFGTHRNFSADGQ